MYVLNQEQKLISQIKNLVDTGGRFIGDDCAVLPGNLLLTTDALVEQTHFRLDSISLNDLSWKAIAVNLSDIAAMAGIPEYALVTLSAPADFYASNKVLSLYEGLHSCAQHYQTNIVGGDITRGTNLVIVITILGRAHQSGVLRRCGAKAGDIVLVTGDFGASAAGLRLLEGNAYCPFKHCLDKHRRPQPRLKESHQLVERTGSRGALMDTSDGLADALAQIAAASNVGMQIDLAAVPIHADTRAFASQANLDPYELALYGGEDYELVACLPAQTWQDWHKQAPDTASSFIQIGIVDDTNNIQLMFGNGTAHQLDLQKVFQHIA